ncbi:MAG: GAF domain-containing protein [Firmicutes bacterium]|nr:GAF domain-containing protein [Bacillota bacterium]
MYDRLQKHESITERYPLFLEYVKGYMDSKLPSVSNYANFSALVYDFFDDVNWAGFYLVKDDVLYLGPFQGKPACTEIRLGSGVCGTSAQMKKTLIVKDTSTFEGHIVCDSASRSEIVIPLIKNGVLIGVLDIDSPLLNRFTDQDRETLEKAVVFLIDIL